MGILTVLATIVFVFVCTALVLVILIQPGKGEGMAALGGMSTQIFGGGGAVTFLAKLTTGLAIAYMVLVIVLTRLYQPTHIGTVEQQSAPIPEAPSAASGSATPSGQASGSATTTTPAPAASGSSATTTTPAPAPASGGN
ncbi:preprotein translocase subunit SecG [Candidatus Poribacteria bacterium]|nr:preprotein translocase subunit SecG [Candidatus Poribacteria bacterium]